ncbi:MAG TPA: hypothetical protein VFU85_13395, partial [Nocardioides sp.]|nr:hypothetical protein [Nocardioides sp.]
MSGLTRGPLPARTYWTRRAMVLGTAVLLVFGIARALGAGTDASSQPEAQQQARQVAAAPSTTLALPGESPTATESARGRSERKKQVVPLAVPDGPCEDEDVAVTPTVDHPVAGRDVRIDLELRTIESEACTWEVSPEALTLKVTSGDDEIWTSRHCPRAVPREQVTLRRDHTTRVEVTWDARRSDEECSKLTKWALPGWYHVAAAALAGEPSDLQFELERPEGEHVTKTVEPKPEKADKGK